MDIKDLETFMIENGIVIRAIPRVTYGVYEVRHKDRYPDGEIYYDEKFKRDMLKVTKYNTKIGGKFIIDRAMNTGSTIKFYKPKFYDTIEEAIASIVE